MDDEVKGLLHRTLKDLVTLEVTFFFHGHPDLIESQEGISRRLARETATIVPALEALVEAGIVECSQLGDGRYEVFSFTNDSTIRSIISRLHSYYHENTALRAEIIKHIVSHSIRPQRKESAASSEPC